MRILARAAASRSWSRASARIRLWLLVTGLWCVEGAALGALPSYFFAGFEANEGWALGPLTAPGALRLIRGEARVVDEMEPDSERVLELEPSDPGPAVLLEGAALGKASHVYCDLLTKPFALGEGIDEEFLDFGGAIVGFYRVGAQGEIRALFERSEEESVWISTGARFPIERDGISTNWLRLTLHLNRTTRRWDLRVNGDEVLKGLLTNAAQGEPLLLWLFGSSAAPVRFDELLMTTVEPDHLRKLSALNQSKRVLEAGSRGPKVVTGAKPNRESRRQGAAFELTGRDGAKPNLRGWSLELKSGGNTYKPGSPIDLNGEKTSITAFAATRDDQGNTLPGAVTLTADAELRPGTDLGKIRWLIAEPKNFPHELGEVMAVGGFETGLVQTVRISPEWMHRAMLVRVWVAPASDDDLWIKSRQQR